MNEARHNHGMRQFRTTETVRFRLKMQNDGEPVWDQVINRLWGTAQREAMIEIGATSDNDNDRPGAVQWVRGKTEEGIYEKAGAHLSK